MRYFEVAVANVRNRNTIIETKYLKNYIKRAQIDNQELYRSYYTFDKDMLDHMNIQKTVKSFKGDFYHYSLLLDIDKGKDSDEWVLRRAKEFVISLFDDKNIDYESMRIWFSGSGYHIEIPNVYRFDKGKELPEHWRDTADKWFPEVDLKPLVRTGLIRVGYTINLKTNLYKIPLTKDELFNLEWKEIHELAKSYHPREGEFGDLESKVDLSADVIRETHIKTKLKNPETVGINVTCMSKLFNRGPEKGRRHEDLLRLVSSFRRKDIPKEGILSMMKSWAHTMDEKEIIKIVNNTYDADYKYGCQDKIMKEFCDPKCKYFLRKNYGDSFLTMDKVEQDYVQFIRSDYSNISFDFKDIFKGMDSFIVYPKELVVLIGDTKLGKTALIQNIVAKLRSFNVLFYTLETSSRLMYRRQIQIEYGYSKAQVNKYYEENTNTLSNKINHIKYNEERPSIGQLESMIVDYSPKLVVIDTFPKVRPTGIDMREYKNRDEAIAMELKSLATRYDTIMLVVNHITKDAASLDNKGNKKELGVHSGKGDSAIEQEADKLLSFEGDQDGNKRRFRSLGARDEAPFDIQLFYNKNNFRMFKV